MKIYEFLNYTDRLSDIGVFDFVFMALILITLAISLIISNNISKADHDKEKSMGHGPEERKAGI